METEPRKGAASAKRELRRRSSVPENRWFSGHRQAERRRVRFPVDLHGANLTCHGIALDLSSTGMLVSVPRAALAGRRAAGDLLGVYVTLHHTWEDGVAVAIPGEGTVARAHVARIMDDPAEATAILLGLAFERPLEEDFVERRTHRSEGRA